jgi:glycine oxidase
VAAVGARADVVVAGNGVVGLMAATAVRAAVPDATVTVVGPLGRPGAASPAAGAMLSCFGEVTRTTLTTAPGRARFAVQLAAHRRWPAELEMLSGFSDHSLQPATDSYLILNSRGGVQDTENFVAALRALDEHREPYEVVDDVPGLDPVPDARPLRSVHLPAEGAVHSGRLLAALEARATAAGVRLVHGTVRRVRTTGGRVDGVKLGDGDVVTAGTVVVATGAALSDLLDEVDEKRAVPPVVSGCGVAYVAERVVGRPLGSVVRTVVRAGSCGLHVVPLGGAMEYIGATNVLFGAPERRAYLAVCQFLSTSAVDQIHRALGLSRIEELRVGNRPVSFDTFPLLGPGPVDGLWVVGGGFRDGLHAAPEVAELAARSIADGANRFPPELSPCRAPIATMTVEESIDEFVAQQVGSAFEGGLQLTPFQSPRDLERAYRPLAEDLYRRLDTAIGLAPDIVNFLCLTKKSETDVDRAAEYLKAVAGR